MSRRLLQQHRLNGRTLLEVGCGTGNEAPELAALGFRYLGIDVSEAAIAEAADRNRSSPSRFVHADFFAWSAAQPFDVIYEKGFFHTLGGVRRRNMFVRRAASLLRPRGLWLSVCGSADHRRTDFRHGAIYIRDLIGPAEVYFEVLEVVKADYGLADGRHEFAAWHSALRRRSA